MFLHSKKESETNVPEDLHALPEKSSEFMTWGTYL